MPSKNPIPVAQGDRSFQEDRLGIEYLVNPEQIAEVEKTLDRDVIKGLSKGKKTLPSRYLYDDRGSELFEQICELPEYYPTRTEAGILFQNAENIARLTGPCEIVELGSGSSTKTRILLDAYQKLGSPLHYLPIDISAGILINSAKDLLQDYPSLKIRGLVSTYELALERLEPTNCPSRIISFLGSSLGNLNPQECDIFFSQITGALQPGEYFLLGIDLHKSKEILEPAYNDSQGVTAAFNLNMLQHLNRKFESNFDSGNFEHLAFYNEELRQVESYLKSNKKQNVRLGGLDVSCNFEEGETIHTEISRKFDLKEMQGYLREKGLSTVQVWTDERQWFGLILCQLEA